MKIESYLPRRCSRLTLMVLAAACLGVWSVAFPPARAEAGSLVIPAWSFARGNGRIYADPDKYADAGPVVGSGQRQPWGWSLEYDIDIPVTARYALEIRYATAEARPVEVFFDSRNNGKTCTRVTFAPASGGKASELTFNSSGARWETLHNQFGGFANLSMDRKKPAKAGKHKIILASRKPLPHLVALRLTTRAAFPASWQPPQFKVRDLESIPAAHRAAFQPPKNVDVAALRKPAAPPRSPRGGQSLAIPAWTFDRGNVEIYGSPDKYADAGPLVGGGPRQPEEGVVEYDIDFPVTAEYTLHIRYAAAEARPVDVFLDGRNLGKACTGITFGSAPFEQPVRFAANSWAARKNWEGFSKRGELVKLSVTKGKHTLKLARRGPLPNLVTLRLQTDAAFPKGWKRTERKMRHLDRVPPEHRATFLPPGAVNIEALRLAIRDTMTTFGSKYAGGEKYLKQLAELEKKQKAAESGTAEDQKEAEDALKALRRQAMLAHPALGFDKLLFLKRPPQGGHIYEGHMQRGISSSSLCVLSPVSPDGKVTDIAPQLAGGLFSRFDLSFDAKKVVFGYRKKDTPFHIYEVGIDGKGLRQLTSVTDADAKAARNCVNPGRSAKADFHDTDPVYLPNGKILFVSTRSMQNVFCFPATVTNLYVMDADGKNMRRLSSSPLTEMGPTLLDDGRVAYTRWEYVDKGLGNGQGLWAVRPDGSGVDHVYKNSTMRPSGMLSPRSIPGSRRFVTVGCSHMSRAGGPVILVDSRVTRRYPAAMTSITPEIGYPCMYQATWNMGYFLDPYPFSEKFFLVSHSPAPRGTGYGIYVLDAWGNRAELYRDPEISCFQPVPLRPRRRPAEIAPVKTVEAKQEKTGSLFIQDVYEGMTGIERGRVKYVRVMGVLPWPWDQNGMFRIGLPGAVHRKKVYGIAKVHEDGSAYFTVPANENVFFQTLDENYMQLQHMPTFINLMPGEKRSCIGCHEQRRKAPNLARARPLATDHPAQTLAPQPGDTGPRMVDYAADVQPVLDKHCIGCHGGVNPKARLDLTGEVTETWNRSYENIIGKGLISYKHCGYGRSGYRPEPPLSYGSHLSKLAARIRKDPCKANITRGEFVRIITWIDANAPYYGTYRGKRDLKYKDDPDFRPPPLAGK